jgi:uncharacterized protein
MVNRNSKAIACKIMISILICLCISSGLAFSQSTPPAWKSKPYKFVMTPSESADYLYAAMVATTISKDTGLSLTVLESAGSEENMHRIQKKQAEIGCVEISTIQRTFKDQHDLRLIFLYAPGVWQMVVAKEANIKQLKDLDGKKWNPGPAGGGSTRITMQILDLFGVKANLFQGTLSDASDAYDDRQIVGYSYRGTGGEPTPAIVQSNASRPIDFIRLSDDEIAKIIEKFPDMKKAVIQAKLYPGQDEPIPTILNWGTVIAANKDVPMEAVYEFTKSYWKNFQSIVKQYPGVALTSPEKTVNEGALPLHKGAIKYYQEIGLKIPENLIPKEAKQ